MNLFKNFFVHVCLFLCVMVFFFHENFLPIINQFFPLKKVQVEASFEHISKRTIENHIPVYLLQGWFDFNKDELTARITELPWVEQVMFIRKWPDTLVVKVVERKPLTWFNQNGLLDRSGQVFYPKRLPQILLPRVVGKEVDAKQLLQDYKKMSKMLSGSALNIDLLKKEASSLSLTLTNGVQVVINQKQLDKQMARFVKIYPQLVRQKDRPLKKVDLRYKHGLSVKWL